MSFGFPATGNHVELAGVSVWGPAVRPSRRNLLRRVINHGLARLVTCGAGFTHCPTWVTRDTHGEGHFTATIFAAGAPGVGADAANPAAKQQINSLQVTSRESGLRNEWNDNIIGYAE